MKKILVINTLLLFCSSCIAQSVEFGQLADNYKKEIKLPVDVSELDTTVVVDKALLSRLLWDKQEERAKFYANNGKLVNVTTYGKIPQEPMKWETWNKVNGQVKWFNKTFNTKAYSLGQITLDSNYHVWITRVVGFQSTYIDLYVFDKNGKLKSLVNMYEAEYESSGEPSKIASVYITSIITEEGDIKWEENRFNVHTKREYQLQPDGYFKVVKQESEGEFEL
ncbi:MAG TPA: hypothetical protein VHO50_09785 [Bacteroidales bacterium]|nr:hypothetical protein [Bacteroidales bacterium]